MQSIAAIRHNNASASSSAAIVHLKERSMNMLKKDLILRNPLRLFGHESADILNSGGFGAVLARAGVGKTALMVQLSLNTLLQTKNVLHISLNDPINKVTLWYKEVFNLISRQYGIHQVNELWDVLLPHRFIMTFKVEGFSVPKLEERLNDLMEQNIFTPQMVIIDGFPFVEPKRNELSDLKRFTQAHAMHVWFTVRTHRHEAHEPDGMPLSFVPVSDLFDIVLKLQPEGDEVPIHILKGGNIPPDHSPLLLDPSTMLIREE